MTPGLRDALRLPPAAGRSSTALRMPVPQPPTRERLVVRVPARATPRPPVTQTPIRKPVSKTPVIKAPMAAPKKPAPVTPADQIRGQKAGLEKTSDGETGGR